MITWTRLPSGFQAASLGSIIPVNAMPGNNSLEVWWFRSDNANTSLGFQSSYWPAVIGHYNIQWPSGAPEIIMANNAGATLDSLQAKGTIYRQDDPTQPGYNPNEEHAVLLGGQVYALRDDLNVTNGAGYTSAALRVDRLHRLGRAAVHGRVPCPARGA